MYIRFIKVQYYIFYRYILQWYSNKLVKWHVELTPNHSTEDSFTEILLEQIRHKQRKVEQKRWTIWLRILQLSKEMGNPDPTKNIPPVILETEDSMHDKAAENENI